MNGEIEFEVHTPLDSASLVEHVRSALARGLPDLERRLPRRGVELTLVANGPTAKLAPKNGPTVALNGALKLFTAQGLSPTYWIACDPQEMVAGFLNEAPAETIYLICSNCHPAVFDALMGRNVIVWHLNTPCVWDLVKDRDPVATAVSVTIVAFEVLERLGYASFHTWGWDGCYLDGKDHAVSQAHHGGERDRTIYVGEQSFASTTTWALEAQDAVTKFRQSAPQVEVNGPGMIGAILRYQDILPQRKAA